MTRHHSTEFAPSEVRSAAAGVFVLCFPMMLADAVRQSHPLPGHQFQIVAADADSLAPGLQDGDPRAVVMSAWLELAQEPLLQRLPNVQGRFFVLTLMDSVGDVFATCGTRTGNDTGATLALVGPNWRGELPDQVVACHAPTNTVWAVARLYAHSLADRPGAELLARELRVSVPDGGGHGAQVARGLLPAAAISSVRQIAGLAAATFLHRAQHLLDRVPGDYQRALRSGLTALAAASGGLPPPGEWSPALERAIGLGFVDGMAAISAAAKTEIEGASYRWRPSMTETSVNDTTPLGRAVRAYLHLGSPAREDLLRLTCEHDEAGRPLSGDERYIIRFASDAVPPAGAFWRLGIRPGAGATQCLEVRDESDLTFNEDASLDLIIQQDRPDIASPGNWLQSPARTFALSCDLYWPSRAALTGLWRMPNVERLGSGPGKLPRPPLMLDRDG